MPNLRLMELAAVIVVLPVGCTFGIQHSIADPGHVRARSSGTLSGSIHAGAAGATTLPRFVPEDNASGDGAFIAEYQALGAAAGARIEFQATDALAVGADGLAGAALEGTGTNTGGAGKLFLAWNPASFVSLRAGVGGGWVGINRGTQFLQIGTASCGAAYAPDLLNLRVRRRIACICRFRTRSFAHRRRRV